MASAAASGVCTTSKASVSPARCMALVRMVSATWPLTFAKAAVRAVAEAPALNFTNTSLGT